MKGPFNGPDRPRLLICEPGDFSPLALQRLQEVFQVEQGPLSRSQLLSELAGYDVIFVRLGHRLDGEALGRAARLKFIASPTTGLNHIDMDTVGALGVEVVSLRGERQFLDTIYATAEHTWALILSLLRRIPAAHSSVTGGEWDRDRFKAGELHGHSLGIIGFGRIGAKVARYAQAFGMNVMACDPDARIPDGIRQVNLLELFAEAQVISLHVAYNPDNHGLIGGEHFKLCRPDALFINTARGEIVDETALLAALERGRLAGAALDVLSGENLPGGVPANSDALIEYARRHDNLLITPHVGGATYDSMAKTEIFITEKLIERWMSLHRA